LRDLYIVQGDFKNPDEAEKFIEDFYIARRPQATRVEAITEVDPTAWTSDTRVVAAVGLFGRRFRS